MQIKPCIASLVVLAFAVPAALAQAPQPPGVQPAPPASYPAEQALPPIPNPIVVNVLGEVNRPSRIVLPQGSGLLDAIAAANGFSRMANPSKTLLIHRTSGEQPNSVKIDLKRIISGAVKDIVLKDGDTVVVGESSF